MKQCYCCAQPNDVYEVVTPYDGDFNYFLICKACATKFNQQINMQKGNKLPEHYFGDCPICDDLTNVYYFDTCLNSCYDTITMCLSCSDDLITEINK